MRVNIQLDRMHTAIVIANLRPATTSYSFISMQAFPRLHTHACEAMLMYIHNNSDPEKTCLYIHDYFH